MYSNIVPSFRNSLSTSPPNPGLAFELLQLDYPRPCARDLKSPHVFFALHVIEAIVVSLPISLSGGYATSNMAIAIGADRAHHKYWRDA